MYIIHVIYCNYLRYKYLLVRFLIRDNQMKFFNIIFDLGNRMKLTRRMSFVHQMNYF